MNNISDADLKRLYLFKSVNLESIQGVLDACTLRLAAPGEVIIRAGSPNRHIYLLLDGHLHSYPHCLSGEPVVVLGPGEMVGEMSVIDQQPASANVVAAEPCRIMVMEEDILWSLIQSSHDAARNLLFILTSRLRHADQLITGDVPQGEEFDHHGNVDALTGLRGRKWLDNVMQRQFLRSMTCGEPLSMILIDVDHFKAFNNKHGHAYGDRVLYAIAQNLSNRLRPTDIIARYGGDEFVILLPSFSISAAREVAERLHREVVKAVPMRPDGKSVPHPTLSVGLAEVGKGQSPERLVTAAHAALDCAKKNGGDCIVG
jgi:two-component system cell cycle response regulator